MPILPFISDEDLHEHVAYVLAIARSATKEENQLFRNAVDPFSAVFDAAKQNISLKAWIEQEKSRQVQKTLQNKIGEFHQRILGSIPGWVDLGTGHVVDVKNDGKKVIAEVNYFLAFLTEHTLMSKINHCIRQWLFNIISV